VDNRMHPSPIIRPCKFTPALSFVDCRMPLEPV
jgi:hypothetical protein